ncbi:MAG: archease [Syntrophaceae bacterium]|jgi:SHS2 domain-containing protein|nr:archease [Syntrophaceae bacterium]HOC58618.1 archease [Smithellaceae bacterium]HQM44565.1 archease [Smithellaceae bacterium]
MIAYQFIDHTADIGVEIYGRTRRELFTNACRAFQDLSLDRKEAVTGREDVLWEEKITVHGSDIADLLVNFLRELLYELNAKKRVIILCAIAAVSNNKLTARLLFESYSPKRHTLKAEVKAVTYHGLCVEKTGSAWRAKVIFDV